MELQRDVEWLLLVRLLCLLTLVTVGFVALDDIADILVPGILLSCGCGDRRLSDVTFGLTTDLGVSVFGGGGLTVHSRQRANCIRTCL